MKEFLNCLRYPERLTVLQFIIKNPDSSSQDVYKGLEPMYRETIDSTIESLEETEILTSTKVEEENQTVKRYRFSTKFEPYKELFLKF